MLKLTNRSKYSRIEHAGGCTYQNQSVAIVVWYRSHLDTICKSKLKLDTLAAWSTTAMNFSLLWVRRRDDMCVLFCYFLRVNKQYWRYRVQMSRRLHARSAKQGHLRRSGRLVVGDVHSSSQSSSSVQNPAGLSRLFNIFSYCTVYNVQFNQTTGEHADLQRYTTVIIICLNIIIILLLPLSYYYFYHYLYYCCLQYC